MDCRTPGLHLLGSWVFHFFVLSLQLSSSSVGFWHKLVRLVGNFGACWACVGLAAFQALSEFRMSPGNRREWYYAGRLPLVNWWLAGQRAARTNYACYPMLNLWRGVVQAVCQTFSGCISNRDSNGGAYIKDFRIITELGILCHNSVSSNQEQAMRNNIRWQAKRFRFVMQAISLDSGLVSRVLMRTITEGSTAVMQLGATWREDWKDLNTPPGVSSTKSQPLAAAQRDVVVELRYVKV